MPVFRTTKSPRRAPEPTDWDAVARGMHVLADDIKAGRPGAREWIAALHEGFASAPDWWADYPTKFRNA